jgi:hypothetical protein
MSFDLRIRFAGLCLLVPDPQRADPPAPARFHVLLPDVKHEHGGHEHAPDAPDAAGTGEAAAGGEIVEHLPRLIYDRAHESPDSKEFTRELACIDLRGQALSLLGLGPDPIDLFLPGEVANLDDVAGPNRLARKFVDSMAPGPELAARVTLDRGCVTDYLLGVQARLTDSEGEEAEEEDAPRMTAQVEWTVRGIETADGSLTFGPKGVNGGPDGGGIKLYPIGRTIHLEVWNVPKSELPGSPAPNEDSSEEHFAGLFDLLALPAGVEPVAPLVADIQKPLKSGCFSAEEQGEGGPTAPGTMRCMVGKTTLAA